MDHKFKKDDEVIAALDLTQYMLYGCGDCSVLTKAGAVGRITRIHDNEWSYSVIFDDGHRWSIREGWLDYLTVSPQLLVGIALVKER